MDLSQAQLLRDVLEGTGVLEETDEFANALRHSTRTTNGLLIAGPANDGTRPRLRHAAISSGPSLEQWS